MTIRRETRQREDGVEAVFFFPDPGEPLVGGSPLCVPADRLELLTSNVLVPVENAAIFLFLVGMGWPTGAAAEHCAIGPRFVTPLVSEPCCVSLSDQAFAVDGRVGDVAYRTACQLCASKKYEQQTLSRNGSSIGNADVYHESFVLEIRGRYLYNTRASCERLAVLGLQIEPAVRGEGFITDSALLSLLQGSLGEELLASLKSAGVQRESSAVPDHKTVRRAQNFFRIKGSPLSASERDYESYKNATDLGAGGEDITVGQWLGRRAAARVVTPEDKIRQAIAGLGLYPEWCITQEGFLDALESEVKRSLSVQELFVLSQRLGLNGQPVQKLSAIGVVLNISREAVRQIEGKALAKLSHPVSLRRMLMPHSLPTPAPAVSTGEVGLHTPDSPKITPEGQYLASVTANVASLLVPVARLDEEMGARILAEDALAGGLSDGLEGPADGE